MITFLPFSDLMMSVAVLDDKRLQKQIIEAWQILNSLQESYCNGVPINNHPAFKMWEGCENMLTVYGILCYSEWRRRRFLATGEERSHKSGDEMVHRLHVAGTDISDVTIPWWWGYSQFHEFHQGRLLAKDYERYVEFFPNTSIRGGYYWPVMDGKENKFLYIEGKSRIYTDIRYMGTKTIPVNLALQIQVLLYL